MVYGGICGSLMGIWGICGCMMVIWGYIWMYDASNSRFDGYMDI